MDEEQVDDTSVAEEEIELDLTEEEPAEGETVEDVKARLAKAEELAANYKTRAEKAEKKAKETKPETAKDLSQTDLYVLIKADVAPEDVPDVAKYAKYEGISIEAALKTNVVKTILANKAEERKTAEATNTGRARRTATVVSDESLLENARKGILPESDADIERTIRARRGYKN